MDILVLSKSPANLTEVALRRLRRLRNIAEIQDEITVAHDETEALALLGERGRVFDAILVHVGVADDEKVVAWAIAQSMLGTRIIGICFNQGLDPASRIDAMPASLAEARGMNDRKMGMVFVGSREVLATAGDRIICYPIMDGRPVAVDRAALDSGDWYDLFHPDTGRKVGRGMRRDYNPLVGWPELLLMAGKTLPGVE